MESGMFKDLGTLVWLALIGFVVVCVGAVVGVIWIINNVSIVLK